MAFKGPFPPKPFNDSVTCRGGYIVSGKCLTQWDPPLLSAGVSHRGACLSGAGLQPHKPRVSKGPPLVNNHAN